MTPELKSSDLPAQPSTEIIRWAEEKFLCNTHFLVYRAGWYVDPLTDLRECCVDALCSSCGRKSKLPMLRAGGCSHGYSSAPFGFEDIHGQPVISGQTTLCPVCGAGVKALYSSYISDDSTIGGCEVLEVSAIEGHLVLIYWWISRHLDDTAKESTIATPRYAYAVEDKGISCFSAYGSNWARTHQYKDNSGLLKAAFPWDKQILEGTTAENCKLDLYLKCKGDLYPVSYLRLWIQRRSVENLLVQGAGNILADMIRRDCKSGYWSSSVNIPKLKDVYWREKRPAQMLGLNKEEFRCAVRNKWNLSDLEIYKELRSRESKLDPENDIPIARQCGVDNVKHLLKNQKSGSIMRSVRYLLKQKKRDAITLIDYWRLAALNGVDISLSKNRYPQNLKRAHDQESERQKFDKKRGYPEQFAKRLEQLSIFAFEKDGLLIRPVASAQELYQEGSQLSHCVYSYLTSHATGTTAIMLIRRSESPETPYFTLELDEVNMTVRQNRGLRNCGRTPDVQAFEEEWLDWAKNQKQKSERSKIA